MVLEMAESTFFDFYGPSIIKFIQSNAEKDVELVDQLLALENHDALYSNPGPVLQPQTFTPQAQPLLHARPKTLQAPALQVVPLTLLSLPLLSSLVQTSSAL